MLAGLEEAPEIERVMLLGKGGSGEVWKAWDRSLHRWVALKVAVEATSVARLSHPNIVPIHRVTAQGIVMQYIEGKTLAEAKLSRRRVLEVIRTVALAVHYAHQQGVIHRDLKPENIMIDAQDHVWVVDFGIAHHRASFSGTPGFMSPEQERGQSPEPSMDLYALGATLKALGGPERIVRKAMNRGYATALDLADDIHNILNRKYRRYAVLVLVALLALVWWNERSRGEALEKLSALNGDLVAARQGWYQAQADPVKTRQNIESVLTDLTSFVRSHPRLAQGYYTRARGLVYLDRLEQAQLDLERALDLEPSFGPAWSLLGLVKLKRFERDRSQGHWLDDATEAFDRGWVPSKLTNEEPVAEILAQAMRLFYVDKKHAEARKLLERASVETPSEEICLRLAQWSPRNRIAWCDRAIEIMPHDHRAFRARAFAHGARKDWARAKEDFSRVLQILPNDANAYAHRGGTKIWLGDFQGGLEDCNRALELDPRNTQALAHRAGAKRGLGDGAGALEDCARALEIEPKRILAYVNRGEVLLDRGDAASAIEECSKSIQIDPKFDRAFLIRARAKLACGDRKGAEEDLNQVLKLDPRDPDALRLLAR
jgi:tetratricopeptide (TPR) repeat protein/predicted Ser/Thr protein kinase